MGPLTRICEIWMRTWISWLFSTEMGVASPHFSFLCLTIWQTDEDANVLARPCFYSQYFDELETFATGFRHRDLELYDQELWGNGWARVGANRGILIAAALDNWTDDDYFVGRYLDKVLSTQGSQMSDWAVHERGRRWHETNGKKDSGVDGLLSRTEVA